MIGGDSQGGGRISATLARPGMGGPEAKVVRGDTHRDIENQANEWAALRIEYHFSFRMVLMKQFGEWVQMP